MSKPEFGLAVLEQAKAIERIRHAASDDLVAKLGPGHWGGKSRVASIRERIKLADVETLRRSTLFVAAIDNVVVGSVVVSTFPPGFWKKHFWSEPKAVGLGVTYLVVDPAWQGKGIGKFLMESVEQLAREHSIPFVRLDAYTLNPFSTAFYRKIGYDERAVIDLRGVGLVLFEKRV